MPSLDGPAVAAGVKTPESMVEVPCMPVNSNWTLLLLGPRVALVEQRSRAP